MLWVLEARHLGYGGTGRNGGQVMAGGLFIESRSKYVGAAGMEMLFKISNTRRRYYSGRIRKYHIDADFVPDMVIWPTAAAVKRCNNGKKNSKPPRRKTILNSIPVRRTAVIGSDVYCGVLKHMGHVHSLNCAGLARAAGVAG